MFGIIRKTFSSAELLKGKTDYHSHVLPGVDDGIQTLSQSLKTLKTFERMGLSHLWLTPHVMEDYPNETQDLKEKFNVLCSAYKEKSGDSPIDLSLAAEYMLDSLFVKRLENHDLLTIIDESHLLVETSYYNPPIGFNDLLKQIIREGYVPILAHPERYHYMSKSDYKALYSMGIKLQLDIMSSVGAYGEEAQYKALSMLRKGYYYLAGSDIHDLEQFMEIMDVPVRRNVLRRVKALMK